MYPCRSIAFSTSVLRFLFFSGFVIGLYAVGFCVMPAMTVASESDSSETGRPKYR